MQEKLDAALLPAIRDMWTIMDRENIEEPLHLTCSAPGCIEAPR